MVKLCHVLHVYLKIISFNLKLHKSFSNQKINVTYVFDICYQKEYSAHQPPKKLVLKLDFHVLYNSMDKLLNWKMRKNQLAVMATDILT